MIQMNEAYQFQDSLVQHWKKYFCGDFENRLWSKIAKGSFFMQWNKISLDQFIERNFAQLKNDLCWQ